MATFIMGGIFFGLAILGLSLGSIFKKRTPLKGHCHTPVDGSTGCASCGDGATRSCDADELKRSDLSQGNFQIQPSSNKISVLQK